MNLPCARRKNRPLRVDFSPARTSEKVQEKRHEKRAGEAGGKAINLGLQLCPVRLPREASGVAAAALAGTATRRCQASQHLERDPFRRRRKGSVQALESCRVEHEIKRRTILLDVGRRSSLRNGNDVAGLERPRQRDL